MEKALFSLTAALLAAFSLQAGDTTGYLKVTDVTLTQNKRTQDVIVTYSLENSGAPAFVLLDIRTNDVSIGIEKIKSVKGDISIPLTVTNAISEGTGKTITWNARQDWRGNLTTNAQAHVLAYYTNNIAELPGAYMVIDISGGTSASSYPVSYTLAAPEVNAENRTSKLWLKRIEPNTFWMGRPEAEAAITTYNQENEIRHQVQLTHAFYTGVFLVTRRQYCLVTGLSPAGEANSGDYRFLPVGNINYNDIRGSNDLSNAYNWPTTTAVDPASFIGRIRAKTGIAEFDLPTDAQLEYATRAGTTGSWNDGGTITNGTVDLQLDALGWYAHNRGSGEHPTGLLKPNAWGLYDTHGSIYEFCVDWFMANPGSLTDGSLDPKGPSSGSQRVRRNGSIWDGAQVCRSAFRIGCPPQIRYGNSGFRLCRTMP